jgi:hypothetical protein
MSGSFDQNERALGAQFALETLRNMITESDQQAFSRSALIDTISFLLDAISGADSDDLEGCAEDFKLAEVVLKWPV